MNHSIVSCLLVGLVIEVESYGFSFGKPNGDSNIQIEKRILEQSDGLKNMTEKVEFLSDGQMDRSLVDVFREKLTGSVEFKIFILCVVLLIILAVAIVLTYLCH